MVKIARKYLLLLGLLLQALNSYAQLSPGELSKVHAHLEGLANCTKCHVLNQKETTSKCLECHTEIQSLIDQGKGYHASSKVESKKCAKCHGEHFGRNFEITRFDKDKFNHDLSGYKLEGKHNVINCTECHKQDLITHKISKKKSGISYLGLGTECLSCHADFHQSTLSNSCLDCHNQDSFRPAPGFDHAQTHYPLIGKHQTVDCEQCHPIITQNDQEFQKFSGINYANCTDCHTDIHNGKFGNDCRKCHSEFSFHQVKGLDSFNHDMTNFPLKGRHQYIDCRDCHTQSLTATLKHGRCNDCHSDYHERQFAKKGASPDCAECHTVEGFAPSTYTIEKHNFTDFPLEGAHLATPCIACHKTETGWNFTFAENKCIRCHDNFHQDVLPEKYLPENNCQCCHTVIKWSEIQFDHNQTNYQLQGRHQEVSCRNCHFSEDENGLNQQFSGMDPSCVTCHTDIHFKQFIENGENKCERCHVFTSWKPEKFDHNNTRFVLDGKHATLECYRCHTLTDGLVENYIVYKFDDISCSKCH
ncbi:hypothetical protein [Saccharicrinis sp. 156]|uniref:hypothetical protein n=1 Tax=Saccharicrinis sp. 156 TaxID=3417574 RepID=UPI003D326C20